MSVYKPPPTLLPSAADMRFNDVVAFLAFSQAVAGQRVFNTTSVATTNGAISSTGGRVPTGPSQSTRAGGSSSGGQPRPTTSLDNSGSRTSSPGSGSTRPGSASSDGRRSASTMSQQRPQSSVQGSSASSSLPRASSTFSRLPASRSSSSSSAPASVGLETVSIVNVVTIPNAKKRQAAVVTQAATVAVCPIYATQVAGAPCYPCAVGQPTSQQFLGVQTVRSTQGGRSGGLQRSMLSC